MKREGEKVKGGMRKEGWREGEKGGGNRGTGKVE